jgi:hypothetical protein
MYAPYLRNHNNIENMKMMHPIDANNLSNAHPEPQKCLAWFAGG